MPRKFKVGDRVEILEYGTIGFVDGIDPDPGMAPYWVSGQTWFARELKAAPRKTKGK